MDSDNILIELVKYGWVSLVAVLVHLYRRVVGIETRSILLEQSQAQFTTQRTEDRELRAEQRAEMIEKFDQQHGELLRRLDDLQNNKADKG